MDAMAERKTHKSAGTRRPAIQPVALSTELPQLLIKRTHAVQSADRATFNKDYRLTDCYTENIY
jgi:hypothetical protein